MNRRALLWSAPAVLAAATAPAYATSCPDDQIVCRVEKHKGKHVVICRDRHGRIVNKEKP